MNLTEGTRRLALFVGIIGAVVGGVASYAVIRNAMEAQSRHNAFELLANSDVVRRERKSWEGAKLPPGAVPSSSEVGQNAEERPPDEPKGWEVVSVLGTGQAVEFNPDHLKTIHWTKDLGVESLDTVDGKTLYPPPAPSRWLYLLAAICPVLGFALPWGLIWAVGWVGAGFLATSR